MGSLVFSIEYKNTGSPIFSIHYPVRSIENRRCPTVSIQSKTEFLRRVFDRSTQLVRRSANTRNRCGLERSMAVIPVAALPLSMFDHENTPLK